MLKTKKYLLIFLSFLVVITAVLFCTVNIQGKAEAATNQPVTVEGSAEINSAEPRGLATNLSLSIGGGNGEIWAKVNNNFTLFPSTIWVYVELYSSETYQESYSTMKLEKMDSIKDLDMGNSITISVPAGSQKYWQARMRYKFDSRDWVTKTTSTLLYDSQGNLIG